ncbi:MAG: hypothetical protein HKN23_16055 [Verrucomicrobiales bacterium]|nr:hypothetical protein [Verrucomicrobiales bacterium]
MFSSLIGLRQRLRRTLAPTRRGELSDKNRLILEPRGKGMRQKFNLQTLLTTLLVFSPAILTGIFVLANAVNIPVWDDWERGVLLKHYYENPWGAEFFRHLTGAHIDHRMIVPRVLIILVNDLTGGNLLWEIALSYSIYVAGAVCLFFGLRKTFGPTPWMYATALAMNVVLFSPVQYQNFLWAVQIAMLLPFACLGFILWAYRADWPLWKKFVVVLVSAWVGTHSFGHGLVLWPIAFVMALLLKELGSLKTRVWFAGGVLAAGTATVLAYFFWNYENLSVHAYGQMPGETPPGLKNFADGEQPFRFVLAAMGNPIVRLFTHPIEYAPKAGRIVLVLFIGAIGGSLYLLRKNRDRAGFDNLLPWFGMAAYAVLVMCAMALGRGAHGWEKGILPRYAGPGVFLAGAITVLIAWLLLSWRERASNPPAREFRTRVALGLGVAWICLQIPVWSHGITKMNQWKLSRYQQRAAMLYINHFPLEKHGRHDHNAEFLIEQANFLNEKGLLDPPLLENADFGNFECDGTVLEYSRAEIIGAGITEHGLYLRGFATLRDPDRLADGILIAFREKEPGKIVCTDGWTLMEMAEMDSVFVDWNNSVDGVFSGGRNLGTRRQFAQWRDMVPLDSLPKDKTVQVTFWAMNAADMKLQRMKTVLEFNLAETPVGTVLYEINAEEEKRKLEKEAREAAEGKQVRQRIRRPESIEQTLFSDSTLSNRDGGNLLEMAVEPTP